MTVTAISPLRRRMMAPEGMENVTLKVVENTADTVHLVLPVPPPGELDDDALDAVAGGSVLGSPHYDFVGRDAGGNLWRFHKQ